MKLKQLSHKHLCPLLTCLCLGALAVSCVNDDLGCIEDKPGYIEGNNIWLSFDIQTEGAIDKPFSRSDAFGSRAGEDGPDDNGHPDEVATPAENYISPTDILLVLLDGNRNVMKVFDDKEYALSTPINGTNNTQYTITAEINKVYFDYITTDLFDLSILVIANINGTGDGSFPLSKLYVKSLTSVSQFQYNFGLPRGAANVSWFPLTPDRRIPMAGLKHFKVNKTDLFASTESNRYDLNTADNPIYVQRSIAKIRVFDNIAENANLKITGVEVKGITNRGAYMPDLTVTGCEQWAEGTKMLEKATMATSWFDAAASVSAVLTQAGDEGSGDYTDVDNNEFTEAFIAYLPEIDLSVESPVLSITGRYSNNTERVWEFPLNEYVKGIDITRNHIYEFTVTAALDSELQLKYTLCPMGHYITDIPGFE